MDCPHCPFLPKKGKRMSRFEYGPAVSSVVMRGGDVGIILRDVSAKDGTVTFDITVPPYDTTKLLKVFAVVAPAAPGEGVTPQDYLVSAGSYAAGVEVPPDNTAVAMLSIKVVGVPPASWFGQTVLEFEA